MGHSRVQREKRYRNHLFSKIDKMTINERTSLALIAYMNYILYIVVLVYFHYFLLCTCTVNRKLATYYGFERYSQKGNSE